MRLRARVDKLERQKRPVEFIVVETRADADRVDTRGDNVVVVITGVCAPVAANAETAETH